MLQLDRERALIEFWRRFCCQFGGEVINLEFMARPADRAFILYTEFLEAPRSLS